MNVERSRLAQMEAVIKLVPDVQGVRIVPEGDRLGEVHVLAAPSRHPKQVVRDVETCLAVHFGVRVDRRCVSVAQIDEESVDREDRIRLEGVVLRLRDDTTEVRVELSWRGERFEGERAGVASSYHRRRLVLDAALAAVDQAVSSDVRLLPEEVHTVSIAGRGAIVVLITLLQEGIEEHLVGTAYVRRGEAEAVARAALSAVNRRLANMLRPPARIA